MKYATEIATSQAVWAILCIVLAGYILRELRKDSVKREADIVALYEGQKTEAKENFDRYREESKERESKLFEHLERSNASQENTAEAMEAINRTMITLEGRMDRMERSTYRGERG